MNRSEFKAISIIAEKLNWQQKPVSETIETIKQMVRNQQALELDTVGECDGDEETLLSIALWNADKIVSTMYVSDYESLVMWGVECFCEDMGITKQDYDAMVNFYQNVEPSPDPVHDEELFIDGLLAEDYWMEMYEAMIETQLSCRY